MCWIKWFTWRCDCQNNTLKHVSQSLQIEARAYVICYFSEIKTEVWVIALCQEQEKWSVSVQRLVSDPVFYGWRTFLFICVTEEEKRKKSEQKETLWGQCVFKMWPRNLGRLCNSNIHIQNGWVSSFAATTKVIIVTYNVQPSWIYHCVSFKFNLFFFPPSGLIFTAWNGTIKGSAATKLKKCQNVWKKYLLTAHLMSFPGNRCACLTQPTVREPLLAPQIWQLTSERQKTFFLKYTRQYCHCNSDTTTAVVLVEVQKQPVSFISTKIAAKLKDK